VSRYYLTTAIDYVNSRPHLGTAYEKVTADVIARYKRLAGFDVHFLMGNDEHSQNVFKKASEEGFHNKPVAYCDRMEEEFTSVWKALHCSYDDFIRTTQPRHKAAVQKIYASKGYRPVDKKVLDTKQFPTPKQLFTIDDLGGWTKVNDQFFDPTNGSVAKIEQDLGVSTAK